MFSIFISYNYLSSTLNQTIKAILRLWNTALIMAKSPLFKMVKFDHF
nr:MAG TPA: hypothetical protein [Caudoviricetes sp.]